MVEDNEKSRNIGKKDHQKTECTGSTKFPSILPIQIAKSHIR